MVSRQIDQEKVNQFLGKFVTDAGAAVSFVLALIGDQLGLYKALASQGPATPGELATRTNTSERYVREWLANQAAGGYVEYDAKTSRYFMTEEQAFCLADENSPVFLPGAFQIVAACHRVAPKIMERFRTGQGLSWAEQDPILFEGTDRFFRSGYSGSLITSWLPVLDGVEEKLRHGAKVADVGCGLGSSTIIMAKAYPKSTFVGSDYHGLSIELARRKAQQAGVGDRVTFEVAQATQFSGRGYDLVAFFDCLHDMADPLGALKHTRKVLKDNGTVMLVEPFANDRVEENLNPVGRMFYGASTLICVPCSLADHGPALGAQAGEARLRELAKEAGFTRFRRATATPFNLILEIRP